MGTWVNSFGEFSPDPFTISCHEYFACENGSKAAVGEELEIWVYFLEIYCSEIYRSEKRRFVERPKRPNIDFWKILGRAWPIVENVPTPRGSIYCVSIVEAPSSHI